MSCDLLWNVIIRDIFWTTLFPWLQRCGCWAPGEILARGQMRTKMFPCAVAWRPIWFSRVAECKATSLEISVFFKFHWWQVEATIIVTLAQTSRIFWHEIFTSPILCMFVPPASNVQSLSNSWSSQCWDCTCRWKLLMCWSSTGADNWGLLC